MIEARERWLDSPTARCLITGVAPYRFLGANLSFEKLWGFDEEDLVGQTFRKVLRGETIDMERRLSESRSSESMVTLTVALESRDGLTKVVESICKRLKINRFAGNDAPFCIEQHELGPERDGNVHGLTSESHRMGRQLHAAVDEDRFEEVNALLEQAACTAPRQRKSKLIEYCNARHETPLFRACLCGSVKSARVLLEFGAKPNAENVDGDTPGSIAYNKERKDCLELLVKKFGNSLRIIPKLHMRQAEVYEPSRFRKLSVLGSGNFGTVIRAEYLRSDELSTALRLQVSLPQINAAKNNSFSSAVTSRCSVSTDASDSTTSSSTFALKKISKAALVETHQVHHTMNERNLLLCVDSPFCVRLLGSYQTKNEVVMVSEVIEGCDLWSVIYEQHLVPGRAAGVPHDLACLYTAGIVFALDHIHSQKIVYRDLKPENIMINSRGYPCLVDFGFAKQVPFQEIDSSGRMRVRSQTCTLCGTPEYVSPEIVVNAGHNQMTDLWSMGVLLYEMIMGRTPFLGQQREDVTQLFTNIVLTKKNGLELSSRIDDRAGKTPHARALIMQLLSGEPSDRLGSQHSSTRGLLKHRYFSTNIRTVDVYRQELVPTFLPRIDDFAYDRSLVEQPTRSFNDDQDLFDHF